MSTKKKNGSTAPAGAKMTAPKSQPHRTNYKLPVVVYFTVEQKQKVETAAGKRGQSMSSYLRSEGLKSAEATK